MSPHIFVIVYGLTSLILSINYTGNDMMLPGSWDERKDSSCLMFPADYRLAFWELGLSIGLHAVEKMRGLIGQNSGPFKKKKSLHTRIESLMQYALLGETIEAFWLERVNRETDTWMSHRDINMVMLATSLAPDGYLAL